MARAAAGAARAFFFGEGVRAGYGAHTAIGAVGAKATRQGVGVGCGSERQLELRGRWRSEKL
jgi:hypothetical protein